ncbi:MAG: hypothetical protein ABIQ74_07055 [Chitinophagales bacterium]
MKTCTSILIFSGFIFMAPQLKAQISIQPVIAINFSGIAGGPGYANFDHDYGWAGGGKAIIPIGKKYFIDPGLIATTKSYKYHFTAPYTINNLEIPALIYEHLIFGYIEAPVSIGRKFSSGLHTGAGVFFAWQLTQRRNEIINYTLDLNYIVTDVTTESFTREITGDKFQAGLSATLGYVKANFDLVLTSQYHLTPLMGFTTDDPDKLHFINLSLSLAYQFTLAKRKPTL